MTASKNAPLVTVVIPNYNGIKYMKECMEALYAQENAPVFEVLVVDNGSTDGSIEQTAELFPMSRIIRLQENTGFCHAVNVGIKASFAPYIILLNNDTKVYPGFVRGLYDAIRRDSRIFSVSAQMRMWDRPELLDDAGDFYTVLGWAFARGKGREAKLYEKPAKIFSACGGAAIYRRSVLEEIGLFDELHFAYLEDVDLGYRAKIYGYDNRYEPSAKVLHYGSASTGARYNARKTVLASSNNIYLIFKNMPALQLIWNLPFLVLGCFIKFLFFSRKKMGTLYLKGLAKGIARSFSAQGRKRRVPFQKENLGNYLKIQIALYGNVIRMLTKF